MLRAHPQIFMPDNKEPWFFASDMRPRFQPRKAGPSPETLEEYSALFAGAREDQRVGEASSSYLWSRTAAEAIAEVQPEARIIAILREPASFLRSLHLQLLQTHVESVKDFSVAIGLESERRAGTPDPPPLPPAPAAALLRARPLRRAAAPLPLGVRRASRCWC